MFTDRMTTAEMVAEYKADIEQSRDFVNIKVTRDVRREVLKLKTCRKAFPVVRLIEWKSARGNSYIIRVNVAEPSCVTSKSTSCDISYYALLWRRGGYHIFDANEHITGLKGICLSDNNSFRVVEPKIYTPHCIARYAERFGAKQTYTSIRRQFLIRLSRQPQYTTSIEAGTFTTSHGGDAEVLTIWMDGLLLGVYDKGCLVLHTYLPFDANFSQRQKEYINEMAKIHLEYNDVYDTISDEHDKNRSYILTAKR